MSTPGARPDGPDPAAVVADIGFADHFDADDETAGHFDVAVEHGGTATDEVGAFATHALLDLVLLLFDTRPAVMQRVDMDMDVAESVVVVSGIFVVDASLELETRRRYVGNDPLAVPYRLGGSSYSWCTESHVRILLVPRWETGIQLHIKVRIGREGIEISHWETIGSMEDEFYGVPRGSVWNGSFVETSSGLGLLFCGAIFGRFLLQACGFVDKLGRIGVGAVILPLAWLFIFLVLHSIQ